MGATHLPTKHTDVSDAPVSYNFLKRLWWRYLHSPQRVSPPLVAFLLLVQILLLVAVKFSPGLSALSSFEGLIVGREVSIRHPFKFLPQERQGNERVSLMPSREREPNDLASSSSSSSSLASPVNDDKDPALPSSEDVREVVNAPIDVSNAVVMTTSSAVAKRKQALMAEKVLDNVHSEGKGEQSAQQEEDQEKAVMQEELKSSENKVSEIATSSETGFPLVVKDEQAEKGLEDLLATSQDDTRSVLLVQDAQTELAQKVMNEGSDSSSQCKYGYIYVYDLPREYNSDIIANCTALNFFLNVCDTLLNGGLGNTLGEASPLGQMGSWFVSDQFTAEVVFHNRILEHPCLTDKPEEATGFYVPYYAGLEVGRFLWGDFSAERRDRVSNQLLEWLGEQQAWKKNGGWGHFMMIGRITWDFRRSKDEDWGSGFFYHPSMQNMTRLLIEKNPWDYMEMAVPYPTNFHPQSDADLIAWQNHIRSLKRSNLFSFAGARRSMFQNDFRGILLDQCQQAQSCQSLDCSNRTCDSNEKSLELFMDSTFCLQPRGDSFTRRSTFDCLLAGSIPVFFWHRSAYMQYKWHLPEDVGSYSVFISKDDMRNGTKIEDVLNSYSTEQVQAMREAVIEIVPRIVYAVSGFSLKEHKDAFDVAIEGVMKRFHELNLRSQRR